MRRHPFRGKAEAVQTRSRMLLAAAVACGLLWLGAVVLAGSQLSRSGLLALGVAGVLLTGTLLLLIQRQHKRLLSLAATDALTGLANHRGFQETLRAEIDHASELARPVALVTLDLDNFKVVNDTHGHPYGDTILSAVGSALREAIRSNDTAARVGGEEFALVLPGSDGEAAFAVAERARANVAAIAVRGFELSCSAGIAAFPADADDPSALCQLADSALYWAKQGGKRRTRRFDPDQPDDVVPAPASRDRGAARPSAPDPPGLPTGRLARQRPHRRL